MPFAVFAAILFALSAVAGQRLSRIFGPLPANFFRLGIACIALGLLTWIIDSIREVPSLHAGLYQKFFWSGLIGFGVGDIALYLAYARLGSRLTFLINWCAASLCAAAGDFWLRGRVLTLPQWLAVAAILAGLVVALWPSRVAERVKHPVAGVLFAIIAGIGMGIGTVLSGEAIDAASAMNLQVHGISQAFQRSTAGVLAAFAAFLFANRLAQKKPDDAARKWRHKPFWLVSAALLGPVTGVSCFQWALMETGNSAIVVAVAATSTLLVIPLARLFEKDKPGARALAGTLMAAAGVVALRFYS